MGAGGRRLALVAGQREAAISPHGPYRRVVLSPHLDDAPLSCGGAICRWARAGEPVLVVTCMAGDPPAGPLSAFAELLHLIWELPPAQVCAARRAEEQAALQVLGADYRHLDLPDCIYRGDGERSFYNSDDEIFGAVHPAEIELVEVLLERWQALPPLAPEARVYAPLGLGNHVDHQLVRAAAERWRGKQPWFYEDFPYAEKGAAALEALPDAVRLQEADLQAKIAAIACYRSQISTLFGTLEAMDTRVRAYAKAVGGGESPAERFWQAAGTGTFLAGYPGSKS